MTQIPKRKEGERKIKLKIAVTILLILSLLRLYPIVLPALAQQQRGPRIDTLRFKVVRSPPAQRIEMLLGPPDGSDVWTDIVRPEDYEEMKGLGMNTSARLDLRLTYFGFNYRVPPLDDVNFRHALSHLIPKDSLDAIFDFIAEPLTGMVSPTWGHEVVDEQWYNSRVDPHPYDPAEAERILASVLNTDGGRTYPKIGGEYKLNSSGTPEDMPRLRVYIPMESVAPTSVTIGQVFVQECINIGLSNGVNKGPCLWLMDFSTYTSLVFDDHDFEIYWGSCTLGQTPDYLYDILHSGQNCLGSKNPTGINWPELDSQLEAIKFNTPPQTTMSPAWAVQEMLAGGTLTNQLPTPAPPEMSQAIPYVPVFNMSICSAFQPELKVSPSTPCGDPGLTGSGIGSIWTFLNSSWDTPNEYRPGTNEKTIVWIVPEYPETLNPTYAKTAYAWTYMSPVFDSLIVPNMYIGRYEPWIATDWKFAAYTGPETNWVSGMNITFVLRDDVTWQDGYPLGASDVKFSWEFLRDWMVPRYRSWSQHITNVTANDATGVVSAYLNTTSQWIPYDLASTGALLPPQIWDRSWADLATILGYDPSAIFYGTDMAPGYSAGPWADQVTSNLFGTGPFILQHSTTDICSISYGDLDANRNYWLTTQEIQDRIDEMYMEMFHRVGGVDFYNISKHLLERESITIPDLCSIGKAFNTQPGDPYWDPEADITGLALAWYLPLPPSDGRVDIDDLVRCARSFGWWMSVRAAYARYDGKMLTYAVY